MYIYIYSNEKVYYVAIVICGTIENMSTACQTDPTNSV